MGTETGTETGTGTGTGTVGNLHHRLLVPIQREPSNVPSPRVHRRAAAALLVVSTGVVSTLAYALISLGQFRTGEAHSYDLGIFSQSAASWASWRLPVSDLLDGKHLLGDHFSPLTAVFGPVWALWPDPRALLLAQAVLLGAGAALVVRAAVRHLPLAAAGGIALAVSTAHGALGAARFDVHEVALAVPFLALAGTALLEERHLAAGLWSLPLLLVKEDLSATVAMVAVLIFWRGRRRLGVLFAVSAVAGLVLAIATMVAVSPAHDLSRVSAFVGGGASSAAGVGTPQRLGLLLAVIVGGGVLWLRSPIALLALPTMAWRLASHEPSYLSSTLHYDAILVPVAGVALVDALRRSSGRRRRMVLSWTAAASSVVVTLVLLPVAGMVTTAVGVSLRSARGSEVTSRVSDLRAATSIIPTGARVAADNSSGAYLLGRSAGDHDVIGWSPETPSSAADWVVVATDRDSVGATSQEMRDWLMRMEVRPDVVVTRLGVTAVVHLGVSR